MIMLLLLLQTIVSGTPVVINANATDNVGVVGVQFKLDGANLGAERLTPPYSIVWNATLGMHSLTAVARDAAGNMATSSAIVVTVQDAPPPVGDKLSPLLSSVKTR